MKSKEQLLNEQYQLWLTKNQLEVFTEKELQKFDDELRQLIIDELISNQGIKQKERMLKHKWAEVNRFLKHLSPELVEEIRQKCWIPNDKSDYRRIQPEMILITDRIRIKRKDIFGNECADTLEHQHRLLRDWQLLATCTSSARNDPVPGRQLRYLVRDKITKKYLGIIAITGTLPNLKPRNVSVFKTNNIKKYFQKNGVIARNMANGQKIIATQPFGNLFNGGKLLSLLCSSDVVANDWKTKFGDVLVSVDTTSLFGGKDAKKAPTQYDGLRPVWWALGSTEGKDTPYKPVDTTYNKMNYWLRVRDPLTWFKINRAKTIEGQNLVREPKNNVIKQVFTKLGIKKYLKENHKDTSTSNLEKRGVYLSRLYKNTDEFLRGEIKEKELQSAFNNSVKFLTELWKYGFEGDTKTYINPEIKNLLEELKLDIQTKKEKGEIDKSQTRISDEMRASAKRRLRSNLTTNLTKLTDDISILEKIKNDPQKTEYYARKLKLQSHINLRLPTEYKWYGFMLGMKWSQVKELYSDELN